MYNNMELKRVELKKGEVLMSVLCSGHNLLKLESLNYELETHAYALRLLVEIDEPEWSDVRIRLVYDRVCDLEQTCASLRDFEASLRKGQDYDGGQ